MAPPAKNVEDCCRLCAVETKNGVIIYSLEGIHLCLEEKIIQCLNIEVSKDDMLPKKVCSPCRERLEASHQFAEQATRVQHTLELMVEMRNNVEEKSFEAVDVKLEDDVDIKDEVVDLPLDVTLELDAEAPMVSRAVASNGEHRTTGVSSSLQGTKRRGSVGKGTSSRGKCSRRRKMLQPLKTGSNSNTSRQRGKPRRCVVDRSVSLSPSSSKTERLPEGSEVEEEEGEEANESRENGRTKGTSVQDASLKAGECNDFKDSINNSDNQEEEDGKDDGEDDDDGKEDGEDDEDGEETDENRRAKEEWKTHWGIKCNQCDQVFPFRSQFDKHYIGSYDKKPVYTCSYCGKTMDKYSTFRSHCYRHVTEGRYRCEYCQKGFSLRSMLHVHILAKHTTVKPFICEECGKGFVTRPGLNIHLKKHKTDEKAEFPCKECGKILHTRGGLTTHQNVHRLGRRFMCDVCGKTFTQKVNMQQHVKHHTGERPYACEKCGKCFAEKSHLNRHYSFHSEKRPFQCTVCHKMYKTERCLKVHAMVHAEARPYVCTYCNKGFLSTTKLKQHYNIHTGERPYACKFCERTFTNYPNWLKHTRRRHKADPRSGVTPLKDGQMRQTQQAVPEPEAILPHSLDGQELSQGEGQGGVHAQATEAMSQLVTTCLSTAHSSVPNMGMLVQYSHPMHSQSVQVPQQAVQPMDVQQNNHHQAMTQGSSLPLMQVYPEHMMTMHMPHHHILPL